MSRSNNTAALVILGLILFADTAFASPASRSGKRRYGQGVPLPPRSQTPSFLENAGARIYDFFHNDAGHKQDLPAKALTRESVLAIATAAGFRDPKLAAAIAMAESGGIPNALKRSSREYSVGLWQINTMAHPQYSVDAMKDPRRNAAAAFQISKGGTDWSRWGAFTNGRYRQFRTGVLA